MARTRGCALEHVQALLVVRVLDLGHLHLLETDHLLLRLEHGEQVELMQLLVGEVDAQLLDGVGAELANPNPNLTLTLT